MSYSQALSRRDFLRVSATALGGFSILHQNTGFGSTSVDPTDDQQKREMYVVGHSHLDAAWLWRWRDGYNLALTTFRSALDRMKETPEFCFSQSSSIYYRWVQRSDPPMFAEILQRIHEGRWEVLGGWPVEPDCNTPSTESFVRHCLYGKRYCKRELGVEVNVGFNPDSFGHAAGLPTILRNAGYKYYAFMRPNARESSVALPPLFWWEGPDGSRVIALRMWRYGAEAERIPQAVSESFAPGFNVAPFFLGVGDHGGAVTQEQIKRILALRGDPNLPKLRWSTLGQFFSAVEGSPRFHDLPVIKGELQHHARGCYSAHGSGKSLNRRTEQALFDAEALSTIATFASGRPYPEEEYLSAWWNILFNQFHDLLAGTAIYPDYEDVRDSLGFARRMAHSLQLENLETMARRVNLAEVREGAVFAFNTLPWRRKVFLQCVTDKDPSGHAPITHLSDPEGNVIPIQWSIDNLADFPGTLSAWVELPPCGYKVFTLDHGQSPQLRSNVSRATVSDSGFGISSLKAEDATELLAGPIGLVVISDTSDTWAHGISRFRQEIGRPTLVSAGTIGNGPVSNITRHRALWNHSEIQLDIIQHFDLDFVELRFVIDWHEHEQILKLEVPLSLSNPEIHAKVPGAVVTRQPNGDEEPYQDWVAVQGSIRGLEYTISLVNDSSYSYDCFNGLLRTVLIRSAPFARHNPVQLPHNESIPWQDQGRQERTFWLLGKRGAYTEQKLDRRAHELQTPAQYIVDSRHSGTEPWERSFLEITQDSIAVLAVKRAEDKKSLVLRMQERAGQRSEATIQSNLVGLNYKASFAPWEIKTLIVTPHPTHAADVQEVSLLET